MEKDDVAEEEVEDDDAKGEEDDDVENDDVEEEEENDAEDDVEDDDVENDDVKGESEDDVKNDDVEDDEDDTEDVDADRSQDRDNVFSSSLRSWNALGHVSQEPFYAQNLQVKCRRPRRIPRPRPTLCKRACAVEIHVDISQEPLYWARKFTGKMAGAHRMSPERGHIFCASLRAVELHYVTISQEPLYTQIYGKNAAAQNLGPHFVRARAVETHVKISQEPLYAEIYTKDAAAPDSTSYPTDAIPKNTALLAQPIPTVYIYIYVTI